MWALIGVLQWWDGGHTIVAEIAKSHISHKQVLWLEELFGEWRGESSDFAAVATWQDDIKSSNVTIMSTWHYADEPFLFNGSWDVPPIEFNITNVLSDCMRALFDDTTTSRWAIHMCMRSIMHFMGDISQPLHNAALFSSATPHGDAGGNYVTLNCSYGPACANLHSMWDSALLDYQFRGLAESDAEFQYNISRLLRMWPPDPRWADLAFDPLGMNLESAGIAVADAYGPLDGQFRMVLINDSYLLPARVVANEALARAGYRLGLLLKKWFDERGDAFADPHAFTAREGIVWALDGLCSVGILVFGTIGMARKFREQRQDEGGLLVGASFV